MNMMVRGIRGAISVDANNSHAILSATRRLLEVMVAENQLCSENVASVIFTVTRDLDAAFPALAAREMGWHKVPMLCATEIEVPGFPGRLVRVLIQVNTSKTQEEIRHIYLGEAASLRPDIEAPPGPGGSCHHTGD